MPESTVNVSSARALLAAIVLPLAIAGCAGTSQPRPEWASAPDADIGARSTFGWLHDTADRPQTLLEGRVRDAIRADLLEKGYVESAERPDLVFSYEVVSYEKTQSGPPVTIGIGMGSWGGNVGGSVGTSVGVGGGESTSVQSRLTIRAVDTARNSEVWIGTTTTFDQPAQAPAVARAVAGVMKGFPGRSD
jgi:hypothetical protein